MSAPLESRTGRFRPWIYLLPLGILIFLVPLFYFGLGLNPRLVPSPLIGQPVPQFSLPRLKNTDELFRQSTLEQEISLLNIWATWCPPCKQEHPTLMKIAASNEVPVYGLLYKDEPYKAVQWLEDLGDPYQANAIDADGKVGIEWGAYGTPETFVIDDRGIVRYKHIGPMSWHDWETILLPLIQSLKGDGDSQSG